MSRRTLLTLALSALLAGAAALGEPPRKLRFGWPDGITANVEARFSGERISGASAAVWDVSCTYQLVVARGDSTVRIERRGFSGWRGRQPLSLSGAAGRIVETIPTLVVSRRGGFVGIEGADEARERFRSGALLSGPAENARLEALTDAAALNAVAGEFWSVAVEMWVGRPVDGLEPFDFRRTERVPELGDDEVDLVGTASSPGATDCVRGGTTLRCLTLTLRAANDPEATAALIESRLARGDGVGPRIYDYELWLEATVVAESGTLLPHQITVRRGSAFSVEPPGSARLIRGGERSVKEYRFRYLAP